MKEKIRKIILESGADICGFADIERFEGTAEGFSPRDIYPKCNSVAVFGVAAPPSVLHIKPHLIYGYFNSIGKNIADNAAFSASRRLYDELGIDSLPIPGDGPYEYWLPEKKEGRGLLDIKSAAVLAGLGQKGKSTLLLNEKYGNMLTLGAMLLECKLGGDELCEGICINGCRKCIENCPVGAISDSGHVDQKKCRENTYGRNARGFDTVDCNICRSVCPMSRGKENRK